MFLQLELPIVEALRGQPLPIHCALYLPGGNLTFTGNDTGGSKACLEIVAYTITFTGNDKMTNTGCSTEGVGLINITNIALAL